MFALSVKIEEILLNPNNMSKRGKMSGQDFLQALKKMRYPNFVTGYKWVKMGKINLKFPWYKK